MSTVDSVHAVRPRRPWSGLALPLAVARIGFRRQFAYPAATFWGLITNLFFGALRVSVLLALFGTRPPGPGGPGTGGTVAGYTVQDAITYAILTQALIMALSLIGWTDLMRSIHRGEVVGDLLRPHSLLSFWAAQDAGRALAQLLLRGVPLFLICGLFWGLRWPAGASGWGLTLLSLGLAWAVGFAFRFLVNCAAFWSPDAVGIGRFAWAVMGLGCGFLMPLAFFPASLQEALAWTPFPAMLNTPAQLWLGQLEGHAAWTALTQQLAWALALLALAAAVLRRGLRRLEAGGG